MKLFAKILSAGALLAVAAPFASASTISIGFATSLGGAVATQATDLGSGKATYAGTNTFGSNTVTSDISAFGSPFPSYNPGSLDTQSININMSGGGGTLYVLISETGLTSPTGATLFNTSFTSNTFTGGVTSVTESSYYDATNATYGLGTSLGTATFTGLGTSTAGKTVNLTGPYSETVVYAITMTGTGRVNDTVDVTAAPATPEPSSLALLGTGLAGVGSLVRRRIKRA